MYTQSTEMYSTVQYSTVSAVLCMRHQIEIIDYWDKRGERDRSV